MDKNTLKEHRSFFLPDYEQEEEYLRQRHREGWRLAKVTWPGTYYFERCQPEDVVYKLDFRPLRGENKEAFLSIYRDYGWEYMQTMNDYCYFRKSTAGMEAADLEIFSDDESKLSMVRRILSARIIPLLVIFVLILLPQLSRLAAGVFVDGWDIALLSVYGVLFFIYIYLFVRCGMGFYRLWKKYSKNGE